MTTQDTELSLYRSLGLTGSIDDVRFKYYSSNATGLVKNTSGRFYGLINSDGSTLKVPYILVQSAVPVILSPNGTVATNGVVTFGTAMPITYNLGAWIRLPADAVVGGSAGLYWCVFTSTTQGQVYTNFADTASNFVPSIPSGALVPAVGSNVAYTQSTSSIVLINTSLPADSLGINGLVRSSYLVSTINNANTKTTNVRFAGNNFSSSSLTTAASYRDMREIQNRGVTNKQSVFTPNTGFGSSTAIVGQLTVDTTVVQQLSINAQLVTAATDFVVIERFCFEVLPSN